MRSAAGVTTEITGVSQVGEERHALGSRDVAQAQHVAELKGADVGGDLLGHVPRQTLDLDVTQVVLDDAAGLHAGRLADLVDLDRHLDLLVAADRQEVDVDVLAVQVVALDLTGDGHVLGAVDLEVEHGRRPMRRVEEVEQVLAGQRDRDRGHAMAVQDAGHEALGAQLAGCALAAAIAGLCFQDGFHGR